MSEQQAEGALDRFGALTVWIGIVIVMIVATGVMISGQEAHLEEVAHEVGAAH